MTIMFLGDYDKDRVGIQTKTTNPSAIRYCKMLKEMGIKNYLFPLTLYDGGLNGIDPHKLNDENDPTSHWRVRVAAECKRNIWYALREMVRIPTGDTSPTPIEFRRHMIAGLWLFLLSINVFLMAPRQLGKSITANMIATLLLTVFGKDISMSFITKDIAARTKFFRDTAIFMETMPDWFFDKKCPKNKKNTEQIYNYKLNTNLDGFVGTTERGRADRVGRSSTASSLLFDESPFTPNIDRTFTSLNATLGGVREVNMRNGIPSCIFMTTTAGDPESLSGKWILENIVNGSIPFSEKMFDMLDADDVRAYVKEKSTSNFVRCVFSHTSLGKTDAWVQEFTRQSTKDEIARDYLNQWVSKSDSPFLDPKSMARLEAGAVDPSFRDIENGFVMNWYIPEREQGYWETVPFIVGMDSAMGVGRDATTLVAIDPVSLKTLFTWGSNEANITRVTEMVFQLMLKYPKMILIPEAKSSGVSIIHGLCCLLEAKDISPFTRIYNDIVQNKDDNAFKDVNLYDLSLSNNPQYRKKLGFMTTATTRDVLYKNCLRKGISLAADLVKDKTLKTELTTLQIIKGRLDHPEGQHDDHVIAWLLALFMVFEGRNLYYYGIPSDMMHTRHVIADDTEEDNEKIIEISDAYAKDLISTKTKAEKLKDEIRHVTDYRMKILKSRELKKLMDYLAYAPVPVPLNVSDIS